MTQANLPADELARTQENVRHNEKAIDRLDSDLKAFRSETQSEFKDVRAEIKDVRAEIKSLADKLETLSQRIDGFAWKGVIGIITIVAANALLKFWP